MRTTLLKGVDVAADATVKGDFRFSLLLVWRVLDEWLRHRLRAIHLKHWKRGKTMHRELLALRTSTVALCGSSRRG